MKSLNQHILEKLIINKNFNNPCSEDMEKLFDKNALGKVFYEKDGDRYTFETSEAQFEKALKFIFDHGKETPGLLTVQKNFSKPSDSITYLKNTGDCVSVILANDKTAYEPFAILIYNSEKCVFLFKVTLSCSMPIRSKTDSKIEIGKCNTLNMTVLKMDFDFVYELDNILKKSV